MLFSACIVEFSRANHSNEKDGGPCCSDGSPSNDSDGEGHPYSSFKDDLGAHNAADGDIINNCPAQTCVQTFAGIPQVPGATDDRSLLAQFNSPAGVAVDGRDNQLKIYVADQKNHRIRLISNGQVTTFAGSGISGSRDDSVKQARFNSPLGIAVGKTGAVYVADYGSHLIRKISAGQVTTIAGNGMGYKDGPAILAQFSNPAGLAVDQDDTVYVADTSNHRIRIIAQGQVTTFAGSVRGYHDGSSLSAKFNYPYGIAVSMPVLYEQGSTF